MATFYGAVKGQAKSEATRRGTNSSGLRVSAQSWNGSVITRLKYNGDVLNVEIQIADGSKSSGYTYFDGSLDELKKVLKASEN